MNKFLIELTSLDTKTQCGLLILFIILFLVLINPFNLNIALIPFLLGVGLIAISKDKIFTKLIAIISPIVFLIIMMLIMSKMGYYDKL